MNLLDHPVVQFVFAFLLIILVSTLLAHQFGYAALG